MTVLFPLLLDFFFLSSTTLDFLEIDRDYYNQQGENYVIWPIENNTSASGVFIFVNFATICYELTKSFHSSELYGITSQIRRASVSVPANIAEGYGRVTRQEYIRYLRIDLGSLRELDTHLVISEQVGLGTHQQILPVVKEVDEVTRLIVSTINKLHTE